MVEASDEVLEFSVVEERTSLQFQMEAEICAATCGSDLVGVEAILYVMARRVAMACASGGRALESILQILELLSRCLHSARYLLLMSRV